MTGAQFSKHFTLLGDKLTRMPYGYEESHPQAKYLKNKSWYVSAFFTDQQVLDIDVFYKMVMEKCEAAKPFKAYLGKALDGYQIPKTKR